MPDIFDEVEEDLRADRMKRLLARYGGLLAGLMLLVVAGVAGLQGWRWWQERAAAQAAVAYLDAGRAAAEPGADGKALADRFAAIAADDPWLRANPPSLDWLNRTTAPAGTDADHPLVQTLCQSYRAATGRAPHVRAFWAASDMRYLANEGGMPAAHFGPGDLRLGHCPNEALPVDELLLATEIVGRFVMEWCGVASDE